MFLNIPIIEWIGYVASVVVAVSLTMSSIIRLRWLNLAGSAVFSVYGFLIGALPVGMLNLFIVFVNIYYLFSIYSRKDAFKLMPVRLDNPYLDYFLEFYKQEVHKFFPELNVKVKISQSENENSFSLLILRNAAVAGVFLGERQGEEVKVDVDFVIPEFRDLKPGNFLFEKNAGIFLEKGVKRIVSQAHNNKHRDYLMHMGFKENQNNTFVKTLK